VLHPASSPAPRRSPAARAGRALACAAVAAGLLAAGSPSRVSAQVATTAGPTGAASTIALDSARVCAAAASGHVRCMARVGIRSGRVRANSATAGPLPGSYAPADLRSAYALPSATGGAGQTVAIVDAYDDPSAEADLGVYRSHFSLPACTTAGGCFRRVDQNGGGAIPTADAGWASETSLDLDMVSAICPRCSIVLVEASSDSTGDIYQAVREAVALGATEVSLSLGSSEYAGEAQDDSVFRHPGVAIVASSGDDGYGVQYPAASPYVTAVGGTTLTRTPGGRGWSETAWSGAGSGCSAYEPKPSWQTDPGCGRRAVTDVSAVANPATGVAVYDTYAQPGWLTFGGTSVAAPIVAGSYALGGGEPGGSGGYAFYQHAAVNDITSGSNGSCTPSYLCTARAGYDGPTGMGSLEGAPLAALTAANRTFVGNLYHDVLGRTTPPADSEVAYWANQLDRGASRSQVASTFVSSSEAHGHIVDGDYQLMLLRAPDLAGRAYWVSQLDGGAGNESILGLFGGAPEYYGSAQKGRGDDRDFITSLYLDLLQRAPAASEVAYWASRIASGTPRSQMGDLLAYSHEHHLDLVQSWYQHYLGRPADPSGAEYWATSLDSGSRDDAVLLNVIASDEYFSRTSAV
jgi:Domain of unknown function (DUF4214)/Subtilase family